MATEQYLTHRVLQNQPFEDEAEKWKSSSGGTDGNSSGGFDCNICQDLVQDPVVTLCGHLYCWPCIYKWISQQSISPEAPKDQEPHCPVCKAEVSERTLIPLYGWGRSMPGSDVKATDFSPVVPCRPKGPPRDIHTLLNTSTTRSSQHPALQNSSDHHRYPPYQAETPGYYPYYSGYDYTSAPAISLAGTTTFHSVIRMFGEIICARFFGDSQSFYTYPNSYNVVATSSARARRHVMQAERSLSRLNVFLWCCLVLCLVLF